MRQLLWFGLLLALVMACSKVKAPEGELAKLQHQILAAGDKNAQQRLADRWWSEYQNQGIPVARDTTALFLYKGPAKIVRLVGDMTGWQPGPSFTRLGATDLFALEQHLPDSARLDYKLIVDSLWTLDPANPHQMMSGFGPNSELRMPHYQPLPWLETDGNTPQGRIEEFPIYSLILDNQRPIRIYLPPGYDQSQLTYPVLYVNDGLEYLEIAKLNVILDHLISTGEIHPLVAICVPPIRDKRSEEYGNNPQFAEFVCHELVPRIQKKYRVVDNAEHRGIMGASFGGLMAFYIALKNPAVFRLVAGQSSFFGFNNAEIFSLLQQSDLSLYSFYLSCGTYETTVGNNGSSFIDMHYRMRDSLRMGMARFGYYEAAAGHSWGFWRDDLPRLLKYLFPAEPATKVIWGI
jgi:enterochelin esterase family protein